MCARAWRDVFLSVISTVLLSASLINAVSSLTHRTGLSGERRWTRPRMSRTVTITRPLVSGKLGLLERGPILKKKKIQLILDHGVMILLAKRKAKLFFNYLNIVRYYY